MGFVIRSVFWLGLVYSAMPMDGGAVATAIPGATGPACAAADLAGRALGDSSLAIRAAAPIFCAATEAAPANPPQAIAAPTPAPRTARAKAPHSIDTLSASDRRAPWRGAAAKAAG